MMCPEPDSGNRLGCEHLPLGWLPSPLVVKCEPVLTAVPHNSRQKYIQALPKESNQTCGQHHLEVPGGAARYMQQWDPTTTLLSDLQ